MNPHTKYAAAVAAVCSLAASFGCEGGTSGGPGATPPPTVNSTTGADRDTRSTDPNSTNSTATHANSSAPNATITQPADSFSMNVPNLATSLKQGETKQVSISLRRGEGFTQNVSLSFAGLPTGVMIDPATVNVKADEAEAKFSVVAAETAALGDATITVTGHPETGKDSTNTFKISIEKK